jgi:NitT/TauT family transport system permease protein/taurine transport system permease protein
MKKPFQPKAIAIGGLSVAIVFFGWQMFTSIVHPVRFASPAQVWSATVQITDAGYAGATLLSHMLHSMRLALLGFLVSSAVAVPVGMAMAYARPVAAIVDPIVSFVRPIPPLAWIPLAIVWFGLGDVAKIFLICITAFVPALINSAAGVRSVDATIIAAARVHGANERRILFDVLLPGALPFIFTGLRLSLQASWMALVAAELVGSFVGLGRVLTTAAQDVYPGMIIVGMAGVAVAGSVMTRVLGEIEKIAIPWSRSGI